MVKLSNNTCYTIVSLRVFSKAEYHPSSYAFIEDQKKYSNAETQTDPLVHEENTTQTEEVVFLNSSPRKEPQQQQTWHNSSGKVSSITITPAHLFNENSTESFASMSTISELQIGKTTSKRKP